MDTKTEAGIESAAVRFSVPLRLVQALATLHPNATPRWLGLKAAIGLAVAQEYDPFLHGRDLWLHALIVIETGKYQEPFNAWWAESADAIARLCEAIGY